MITITLPTRTRTGTLTGTLTYQLTVRPTLFWNWASSTSSPPIPFHLPAPPSSSSASTGKLHSNSAKSFTIDVTLQSNQHSYPALIDSRNPPSQDLSLTLQNGISFSVHLLVTQLSQATPIILGLPWLQEANLDVNWRSMMMTFDTGDEHLTASISLKSQHNPSIEEVPDEDRPLLPDPLCLLGPVLEDLKGEGSARDNTETQHCAAPKTPNPTPMPPLDAWARALAPFFLKDTGTGIIPPSNTNPDLFRLKTDENSDFLPSNINPDLSHLNTNKNLHFPPSNVNSDLSCSKTGKNSNIPPSNVNSDLSGSKTSKNSDIPSSHTNPNLSHSKTSKSSNFPPSHTNPDLSRSKIPTLFPPNIPWNRYKGQPRLRSPSPHPYSEESSHANSPSGGSPQVRIIGTTPFARIIQEGGQAYQLHITPTLPEEHLQADVPTPEKKLEDQII
ncbi:hypothetical protein C0992_004305 [Termitomyces sp. T32_za158]|nr:hypothetical protein C0992_004305 [Termitomyces sp. T32_za158]